MSVIKEKCVDQTSSGPSAPNIYESVTWNNSVNFTAGDCDSSAYTAWCPHNLQYDKKRNKFVFLQSNFTWHGGTVQNMTLCYLDPENPLDYEVLNCPEDASLGALLITDDGIWYIWSKTRRYKSADAGTTWEENEVSLPVRYGVYDIDGILYMGCDGVEAGVYMISTDYGLTWEIKNFGVAYKDCEASFCKFNGSIYAFLRTNTTDYAYIMKQNGDCWELVNDDALLAKNSNCSPVAFDDYIAIAHISRADCHLYYTVWDGLDNFETTDLGMLESKVSYDGDCHCPALAFGNGYACIAFMMHAYGDTVDGAYFTAQNCWVIGSYMDKKETLKIEFANRSDSMADVGIAILQNQAYCMLKHNNAWYLCVDSNEMMVSIQRRNYIVESEEVIDCYPSEEVKRAVYIPARNYVDMLCKVPKYAKLKKAVITTG